MKKTFQITLGRQNFTIEEGAYRLLSSYLDSLKAYFSKLEDNQEIMEDLEGRMAEKLFEMGLSDEVVEVGNIEKIIAEIGSAADFDEVDIEDHYSESSSEKRDAARDFSRDWYTDSKRKIAGGVLAGIAHKFNWDIVWVRVFYLILLFGTFRISHTINEEQHSYKYTSSGFIFIMLYILLWVILPARGDLGETNKARKFYRDPEHRIISGVAAGLSKYLNIKVSLVRLFFIITGMVGIGILLYFIIMLVAPTANTVTKQLHLQGKPITVDNINRFVTDKNTEFVQSRVVNENRVLKTFISIFRVFTGILLVIIGLSFLFASVILLMVLFGLQDFSFIPISSEFLSPSKPTAVFTFFAFFAPALATILGGIMLMINKKIGDRNLWLTLAALWLIGFMGARPYFMELKQKGNHFSSDKSIQIHKLENSDKLFIDVTDTENKVKIPIEILANESNTSVQVGLERSGRGSNSKEAGEVAKQIEVKSIISADTLFLNKEYNFATDIRPNAKLSLKIPLNLPFRFTENSIETMGSLTGSFYPNNYPDNRLEFKHFGSVYQDSSISDFTFMLDDEGKINCLDCGDPGNFLPISQDVILPSFLEQFEGYQGLHHQNYTTAKQAQKFKVSGDIKVIVKKAEKYSVDFYSTSSSDLKNMYLSLGIMGDNSAHIAFDTPELHKNDSSYVVIQLNNLKKLELDKGAELYLHGFDQDQLDLKLDNTSKAIAELSVKKLNLDLGNRSSAKINGDVKELKTKVGLMSYLNTQKSSIDKADFKLGQDAVIETSKPKDIKVDNYLSWGTIIID